MFVRNKFLSILVLPGATLFGVFPSHSEIFSYRLAHASESTAIRMVASAPDVAKSKEQAKLPSKSAKPSSTGELSSEIAPLQALDRKYSKAKSVAMDLTKTVKLGVLGREKKTKGRMVLSQGKLRMELDEPEKSLLIVDKRTVWVVNYPPAEFQNASIQVVQTKLDTKKGRSTGMVSVLATGGLLKEFSVSGVQKQGEETVFYLQPRKSNPEFKRAQIVVGPKNKEIKELRYWDELDNETHFEFTNITFDKPVDAKSFQYTPPEGADVTVY